MVEPIYGWPAFNSLCGFLESEWVSALQQIERECHFSTVQTTDTLTTMRNFYQGYCFSEKTDQLIYNPALALYSLKTFPRQGGAPERMSDSELAMERRKLTALAPSELSERMYFTALADASMLGVTTLTNHVRIEELLSANRDAHLRNLLLYFYYFGLLTPTGRNEKAEILLRIPNLVVKAIYIGQLREPLVSGRNSR